MSLELSNERHIYDWSTLFNFISELNKVLPKSRILKSDFHKLYNEIKIASKEARILPYNYIREFFMESYHAINREKFSRNYFDDWFNEKVLERISSTCKSLESIINLIEKYINSHKNDNVFLLYQYANQDKKHIKESIKELRNCKTQIKEIKIELSRLEKLEDIMFAYQEKNKIKIDQIKFIMKFLSEIKVSLTILAMFKTSVEELANSCNKIIKKSGNSNDSFIRETKQLFKETFQLLLDCTGGKIDNIILSEKNLYIKLN